MQGRFAAVKGENCWKRSSQGQPLPVLLNIKKNKIHSNQWNLGISSDLCMSWLEPFKYLGAVFN